MNWRRWNLLRDALLPLALAVLRCCGLSLWLELARRLLSPSRAAPLLPLPLMIALLLGSMMITRLAVATKLNIRHIRIGIAVTGLPAMLLTLWAQFIRPEYPLSDPRWIGKLGFMLTHLDDMVWPTLVITAIVLIILWVQGILDGRSSKISGGLLAPVLW